MSIDNDMLIDKMNISTPSIKVHSPITQEEYDLIAIKCPHEIYVIANTNKIYLGNVLIRNNEPVRQYLMGISKQSGEYEIYINESKMNINGFFVENNIRLIQKFDDPQKAIDALCLFERVGSHNESAIGIYKLLGNYILRDIWTYDLIIGILSMFGYKFHVDLQNLIQIAVSYGCQHSKDDLPDLFLNELNTIINSDNCNNHIYRLFFKLYDILSMYNFFKCKKYQSNPKENDLSEAIEKIFETMSKEL